MIKQNYNKTYLRHASFYDYSKITIMYQKHAKQNKQKNKIRD